MNFKRIAAFIVAAVLAMTALAACGRIPEEPIEQPGVTLDPAATAEIPADSSSAPTEAAPAPTEPTEPATEPTEPATEPTEPATEPTTEATKESAKKTDKNDFTVEDLTATKYATISLNVRSGPSTEFGRIGALNEGDEVKVTGRASTGWYRIEYKGETGYVSNIYLSDDKPASAPEKKPAESDGDVEYADDEPTETAPDNSSTGGDVSYTAGDWVKDNGAEYMYGLFTESRYQKALDKLAGAVQIMAPTVNLKEYLNYDEAMAFAQYIAQIVGTTYCYFDQVTRVNDNITLTLGYYVDTLEEGQKMVSRLESAGDKILKTISGYSDYNKIKYIYEWIAKNSVYEHSKYFASAYGPIVDGNGTCVGYAKAAFYLLSRAGFDTVYVCGNGLNDDHMWVKVKLGGKWYNVDEGWADPRDGNAIDDNFLVYDFLLVNDEYIKNTRTKVYDLSKYYTMPSATSDDYNWYKMNDCYVSDMSEAESIIRAATKKALDNANGKKYVYVNIQFATTELHYDAVDYYGKANFAKDILNDLTSKYVLDGRRMDCHRTATDTQKIKQTRSLVFRLIKK